MPTDSNDIPLSDVTKGEKQPTKPEILRKQASKRKSMGRGRRIVLPLSLFQNYYDPSSEKKTSGNIITRFFRSSKKSPVNPPPAPPPSLPDLWQHFPTPMNKFVTRFPAYCGNAIRTTKYTIISFIPKNLFEQFHRLANFYFLMLIGLNFIPEVEVFAKEVSMIPLLFVLCVQGLKDAVEDRGRHYSDININNAPALRFDWFCMQ